MTIPLQKSADILTLMSTPKLSVIVPIYNVESFLPECLHSLHIQDLTDTEFILVNDASTDDSLKIAKEFEMLDSRFKIFSNEHNLGLLGARKVGCQHAKGQWILFLDSDDYYLRENALTDIANEVQKTGVDIYRIPTRLVDLVGQYIPNKWFEQMGTPQYSTEDIIHQFFVNPTCARTCVLCCYKASIVKHAMSLISDIRVNFAEDILQSFLLSLFSHSYGFSNIEPIYAYRQGSGISSNFARKSTDYYTSAQNVVVEFDRLLNKGIIPRKYTNVLQIIQQQLISTIVFQHIKRMPKEYWLSLLESMPSLLDRNRAIQFLLNRINTLESQLYKQSQLDKKTLKQLVKAIITKIRRRSSAEFKKLFKFENKSLEIESWKKESLRNRIVEMDDIAQFENLVATHNSSYQYSEIKSDETIFLTKNMFDPIFFFIRQKLNFVSDPYDASIAAGWGLNKQTFATFEIARRLNLPFLLLEDGFIRSLTTWADKNACMFDRAGLSYTIDTKAFYFDGRVASDLEDMLNTVELTNEQLQNARTLIDRITQHKISKYNHQPCLQKKLGKDGMKKVLIIDQSYGDASLFLGGVTDDRYKQMIKDAINENPDAEIYFKVHPDNLCEGAQSIYSSFLTGNVTVLNEKSNPISVIEPMDKVYVATSQMGFEALMLGKEVHVYGLPFYAGWGLTRDNVACPRRQKTRSLEELFYITYVMYSHYVSPYTGENCSLETVLDYIEKNKIEKKYE